MVEENVEALKGELYSFVHSGRKKNGIKARYVLSNLKKICHSLRMEILADLKSMPKAKRNISEEALRVAKEKRQKTIANKKRK